MAATTARPMIPEAGFHAEEEDEEDSFWWRKGLIQAPRQVVRWDHVEETRQSKGIPEKGRKIAWSELFLDLVLVTNVALLGEAYQDGSLKLIEAAALYRVLYMAWWRLGEYAGRFYTDDVVDKGASGLLMFLLLCAGLGIGDDGFIAAAKQVSTSVAVFHLVLALIGVRVMLALEDCRAYVWQNGLAPSLFYGVGFLVLPRLVTDSSPTLLLALLVLLAFSDPVWHLLAHTVFLLPKKDRVPVDVDHVIERRGCLRLILFGEVVTGIALGANVASATTRGTVFLGFLLVFNLKLLAFDVDVVTASRHTYRTGSSMWRPIVFVEAAWLFDLMMGVLGSCLKISIIQLGHGTTSKTARALNAHVLLCCCVAVAVACLTVERLTHDNSAFLGSPQVRRRQKGYGLVPTEATTRTTNLRRVFFLQIAFNVLVVLAGFALALVCHLLDADYEVILVLLCLGVMTTLAVVVNLLDEIVAVRGGG